MGTFSLTALGYFFMAVVVVSGCTCHGARPYYHVHLYDLLDENHDICNKTVDKVSVV